MAISETKTRGNPVCKLISATSNGSDVPNLEQNDVDVKYSDS